MSAQTTPPPASRPDTGPAAGRRDEVGGVGPQAHHRREAPDDHLCACGRLRTDCVRDAVRALWMD
jgi:hypothetical protein